MFQMSSFAALLCAVLLTASLPCMAQTGQENNEHVFRIQITRPNGRSTSLTGFRLNGQKGIVTSLHGVVDVLPGPTGISASNGKIICRELSVQKIDVARDLALLSSAEIQSGGTAGLVPAPGLPAPKSSVTVVGYPYGLTKQTGSTLTLRKPSLVELSSCIPGPFLESYRQRKSPDLRVPVLDLQGPLVPGLSGAPLLNRAGQVFGVGTGGLNEGTTDYVWGMVLNKVQWTDAASSSASLKRLRQLAPDLLSFDVWTGLPLVFPITIIREDKDGEIGPDHYAKTTVTIAEDGTIRTETVMRNDSFTVGYCLRPMVVLLDGRKQVLKTFGDGAQWCTCTRGEKEGNKLLFHSDCNTELSGLVLKGKIGLEDLARTFDIAVVHRPGSKDLEDSTVIKQYFKDLLASQDFLNSVRAISQTLERRDPFSGR